MRLINDIGSFLKTLTFADLVFFFAVLILMILVVTLIYFIKINKEVIVKDNKEETKEMQIVKEITKSIENGNNNITFTDYEKDQENKAIISYEELLNKKNNYELNYEKEEYLDDLSVKKVDLDNIAKIKGEKNAHIEVRVISYSEEEAFLKALKQLQQNLG